MAGIVLSVKPEELEAEVENMRAYLRTLKVHFDAINDTMKNTGNYGIRQFTVRIKLPKRKLWDIFLSTQKILRCKMLQNMDEKQLKLLMIISLIWVFITENLGMYGYATHMRNFFITSTLVYFIGGYCLDHITYKKLKPVHVILIGLVGLLVTIYIRVKYQFKSAYDISLYYILFTFAVYWLGERFFDIKNHIVISIVETLAKYSFYVYMFHYIILNNVEGYFMTLSPSIHMLIVVILTLALSLAWAMVFNVLIKLLEKFIYKLPLLKNS